MKNFIILFMALVLTSCTNSDVKQTVISANIPTVTIPTCNAREGDGSTDCAINVLLQADQTDIDSVTQKLVVARQKLVNDYNAYVINKRIEKLVETEGLLGSLYRSNCSDKK